MSLPYFLSIEAREEEVIRSFRITDDAYSSRLRVPLKVGLDTAEAHHLMYALGWPDASKYISAFVFWLNVNGSKTVTKS